MSISLEKRAEKVGIILAKRGLPTAPPTRVGVALDVSGSAQPFYQSGVMQETLDRLLAVAMKFDDNGELDAWLFHNNVLPQLPSITKADEGTYVNKVILKQRNLWGGTSYAPALKAAVDYYFGDAAPAKGFLGGLFGKKQPANKQEPAMLLFITDGATGDEYETERLLAEVEASSPVYFNMIGIGNASYFRFIERMADKYGNVGFTNLNNLSMTDDELFEKVVNQEFVDWVKKQAA